MTPDLRELLGPKWKRPPKPPYPIPSRPPDADQWQRQDTLMAVLMATVLGLFAGAFFYLCLRLCLR